jgi:hypothetical protein
MGRALRRLALALALAGCGDSGGGAVMRTGTPQTVPRALTQSPPMFDVLRPGSEVPAEVARFAGVWIADGVDGFPYAANARTIIAVTYLAPDGDARVERAETVPGGALGLVWTWRVTARPARITRGVLALDADQWLTYEPGSPPALLQHRHADEAALACYAGEQRLEFVQTPP